MHLVTFERGSRDTGSATSRAVLEDSYGGVEDLEEAPAGGQRIGAILEPPGGDEIVDLNRAYALKLAVEDAGAPEAEADSRLPAAPLAFLRGFDEALEAARAALAFVAEFRMRYDGPDLRALGVIESRSQCRLHAPLPRPGKLLGVARNYPTHAAEQGSEAPPSEPVLFLKASSAVVGPDAEIRLPALSQQVDFEGELAVVLGRLARNVPEERALDYVAGYCAANDVSARDYQGVRGQHHIGKSFDTFAPLGPALVTRDEIPNPQDLAIHTRLSGESMQAGNSKEMTFSVATMLAFASRLMTLEPGDVLLTGTPAGVGKARQPPRFLRDGDVVEVEIERIGRLRNFVRSAPEPQTGS